MLDKLKPALRHAIILAAPPLLGWLGTVVIPALNGKGGAAAGLGALLSFALLYLTPLTQQYGVAKKTKA